MTECGVSDVLDKAFIYFLELTVPASMVICMILLLRLMLKGQKKIWSYALWLVVLLRLVLPAGIAVPVHGLEMPAVAQRYTLSDVQISLPEAVEGITQGNPTVTVEGSVAGCFVFQPLRTDRGNGHVLLLEGNERA